ncbi:MAG: hypothetical protein ACPGVN_07805 [Alphaproteobacteria bacterium]
MLGRQNFSRVGKATLISVLLVSVSGCGMFGSFGGFRSAPPVTTVDSGLFGDANGPLIQGSGPEFQNTVLNSQLANQQIQQQGGFGNLSTEALIQAGIDPRALTTPDAAARLNDPVFASLQNQSLSGGPVAYDPRALQGFQPQGLQQQGFQQQGFQQQGFQQIAGVQTGPQQFGQFPVQQGIPQAIPQGIQPNAVAGFQQAAPQFQVQQPPFGQIPQQQVVQSFAPQPFPAQQIIQPPVQQQFPEQQFPVQQFPVQQFQAEAPASFGTNFCPTVNELNATLQNTLAPVGISPYVTGQGNAVGFVVPISDVQGGKSVANGEYLMPMLAQVLSPYQTVFVQVIGHTAKSGNDALELSYTDTLASYLGQQLSNNGVDAARVQSRGFGSRVPSLTGSSERAEFRLALAKNCSSIQTASGQGFGQPVGGQIPAPQYMAPQFQAFQQFETQFAPPQFQGQQFAPQQFQQSSFGLSPDQGMIQQGVPTQGLPPQGLPPQVLPPQALPQLPQQPQFQSQFQPQFQPLQQVPAQ